MGEIPFHIGLVHVLLWVHAQWKRERELQQAIMCALYMYMYMYMYM